MPISGGAGKEELREELGWNYICVENSLYHPNKNAQFTCRHHNSFVTPTVVTRWDDANKGLEVVGTQDFYFVYLDAVTALYSKKAFQYGAFGFQVKLPDPADSQFRVLWIGAEPTGSYYGGILGFRFDVVAGAIRTQIYGGSINLAGLRNVNVSALMPVTPSNALYRYLVKVNRASVEYWVQQTGAVSVLVGIIQFAPDSDTYDVVTTAPYYLGQVKGQTPCFCPALMEWGCLAAGDIGSRSNIQIGSIYVTDGEPAPLRTLHPYTGGVAWEGTSVVDASITSGGIPIAGYKHKTVYFLATGAGTLDISIDYGDNAYDSITPTPLTVVANQLLTYPTENDGLWLRLIYTPTVPPKTITRARVMMSD